MITGRCHCGEVRYSLSGEPVFSGLCHCSDCRRHAGAPMVGWTAYPEGALKVLQGAPKVYESSQQGRRHFCPNCGTGLFYYNGNMLPGMVDVQTATLDDPNLMPPQLQVQVAERLDWMTAINALPHFDRYPPRTRDQGSVEPL